jgi:hypothetical protein
VDCLSDATKDHIIPDYIPNFRFGEFSTVEAVTVSINPAENVDGKRPLPMLSDYHRTSRLDLATEDLDDLSSRSDHYYRQGDMHPFFLSLEKILQAIDPNWTYASGKVAHIDLVACVTTKLWSQIRPKKIQDVLIAKCEKHFVNTLTLLPPNCLIVCDGATVLNHVPGVKLVNDFSVAGPDKPLTVSIGSLTSGDRVWTLVAWNRTASHLNGVEPRDVGETVNALKAGTAPISEWFKLLQGTSDE